jgi:hypothetical protein
MSTTAKLFIDPQPALGKDATRFTVDCKWGTTRLIHYPGGPLELSQELLITVALQRHEEECGRCNLTRLWQHGDLSLKAMVDATWDRMQETAMRERRN